MRNVGNEAIYSKPWRCWMSPFRPVVGAPLLAGDTRGFPV